MTVGELRKALEGVPDDLVVLLAPSEDSYSHEPVERAAVEKITAGSNPYVPGDVVFGNDEKFPGPKVDAVVIW